MLPRRGGQKGTVLVVRRGRTEHPSAALSSPGVTSTKERREDEKGNCLRTSANAQHAALLTPLVITGCSAAGAGTSNNPSPHFYSRSKIPAGST